MTTEMGEHEDMEATMDLIDFALWSRSLIGKGRREKLGENELLRLLP